MVIYLTEKMLLASAIYLNFINIKVTIVSMHIVKKYTMPASPLENKWNNLDN